MSSSAAASAPSPSPSTVRAQPSTAALVYCWLAGLCDLLTGILLVLSPETVLAMLGLPEVSEPIFLRYVGVFVANVGLAYSLPWWPRGSGWSPHGRGASSVRASGVTQAIEQVFALTALVRLSVASFLFVAVLADALAGPWLLVGLTDLALAGVQIAWLRRGGVAQRFFAWEPSPMSASVENSSRLPGALPRMMPAVLAVAGTYIYFLLWAQFGFLHLLRARVDAGALDAAMACMGLAGLGTSLLMGRLLGRGRDWIGLGFLLSAGAALLALPAQGPVALSLVAAAIGAGTAVLTVSLAAGLAGRVEPGRLGLVVGLGTGLAYAFCNLPFLFDGSPEVRAWAVILVCALGWGISRGWGITGGMARRSKTAPAEASAEDRGPAAEDDGPSSLPWPFVGVLASFLVLIWLDSAAFVIIQDNLALKGHTWEGPGRQLLVGAVHFLAAVLGGWLIDRGFFRSLLLTAFGLFTLSFTVLQSLPDVTTSGVALGAALTGPIYAVGISLYSVALVCFPGLRRQGSAVAPRWRAAWVFGVGGWLGSALGVGMAQDLHRIPTLFLWITGLVLVGTALFEHPRAWTILGRHAGLLLRAHGVALLAVVAGLLYYGLVFEPPSASGPALTLGPEPAAVASHGSPLNEVERGRRVYVEEGCVHCHSRYVRPGTADEQLGPHRPLDREGEEGPVMIGTRRQGPDLSWVGDRRDRAWLERHLRQPDRDSPGSRMPSYAHLFEGSERGDALVAFLSSLSVEAGAASAESVAELAESHVTP